jgi:hypothetical protein
MNVLAGLEDEDFPPTAEGKVPSFHEKVSRTYQLISCNLVRMYNTLHCSAFDSIVL